MKWTAILLALVVFLLLTSVALADPGDDYDLSWWTVDGGGGALSGGEYTLAGTAGQPDAAVWQGGEYTLVGGFWGGAGAEYSIYLPMTLKKS